MGFPKLYAVNRRTKEHKLTNNSECNMHMYPHSQWKLVEADADGWIDWRGGEYPLPVGARFDTKTRNGETHKKCRGWRWTHDNSASDIVAYRPNFEPQGDEFTEAFSELSDSLAKALRSVGVPERFIVGDSDEQPKEWNGESWPPPIGCFVESFGSNDKGVIVEVLACRNGNVIGCVVDTGVAGWVIKEDTRPIRTDRERWIEEAAQAAPLASHHDLGDIYDAGLAKMPGE